MNRLDVELDFIITVGDESAQQIAMMQGVSAIHREDWPLADKCEWVIDLLKTMSAKDIAAELGVDPAMVSNWRAYERLIPDAKQAVRDGRVDVRSMGDIAKLSPDEQPILLNLRLNGASREDVARESRKRRNGSTATKGQTAKKIKIPLATEAASGVVTVAADEIDLEDAEVIPQGSLEGRTASQGEVARIAEPHSSTGKTWLRLVPNPAPADKREPHTHQPTLKGSGCANAKSGCLRMHRQQAVARARPPCRHVGARGGEQGRAGVGFSLSRLHERRSQ